MLDTEQARGERYEWVLLSRSDHDWIFHHPALDLLDAPRGDAPPTPRVGKAIAESGRALS